jgi:transposase
MARANTAKTSKTKASKPTARTLSGTTEEVVGQLVDDGNKSAVLEVVKQLERQIKKLQLELAKSKEGRGRHSEGITNDQLALLFDELKMARQQAETPDVIAAHEDDALAEKAAFEEWLKKKAAEGKKPPKAMKQEAQLASLPHVDNPLPVPEDQHACPTCSLPTVELEPEVTEIIDYKPGQVFVRRDIREVRTCRANDCGFVRGPLGDKVISGGLYGSRLIAHIVITKYRTGVSLHRIREDLQRMGLDMPSASISDQVLWATDLLEPVWRALLDEVVTSTVMQIDGTGIPVHHKEKGKPQVVRRGTLSLVVGDARSAAFTYASTGHKRGERDADMSLEDLLALRPGGLVVADADNKFDASFLRHELIECGCSMHGRRYFVKSLDAGDARAAVPIAGFKKIYAIERVLVEEEGLREEALARERTARAGPVWEQLKQWCEHINDTMPPASKLAVAARYILRHYEAITRYLTDGRIPIDNGLVERLFRRVAIVRKNALFVGSHDGGRRAAVIFSVLTTCELIGLNPEAYLADILPRLARGISLADDLPALMPHAWLAAHPEAAVPAMNVQRVSRFEDAAA